jgi:iron complex outermembrane recepter protein
MMNRLLPALFVLVALAAAMSVSGGTLTGRVVDAATGRPLPGARVELVETHAAAITDDRGRFTIEIAAAATLVVSHTGYQLGKQRLASVSPQTLEIALEPTISLADRIEVTATRAREGADPVSFSNIPQERVAESYWSQDPAILLAQLADRLLLLLDPRLQPGADAHDPQRGPA